VLASVALVAGVAAALLPGRSHGHGAASPATVVTASPLSSAAPSSTATTRPPATTRPLAAPRTTTTGPDPGALPQTTTLPTATDVLFREHVGDLWRAVVDGVPAEGVPFFFPLGAYIQVKGISDPVHDYDTRLIPDYEQDIMTLHARLGAAAASASMTGVTVPDAAEWIVPGVEYNRGSYWRVYGTEVSYVAGGVRGSFEVTSMISWRGEWYVVHLGQIR
jgi:hypothetical protein